MQFLRRRGWPVIVVFLIGAILLGHSLFVNLTRTEIPEFRFQLTIDKAGSAFEMRAAGARKLYGQQFYFDGERVNFLGEIKGERVTITGTVRSGDAKQARIFKAEGTIAEKRMISSLVTDKGAKIGRIELLF